MNKLNDLTQTLLMGPGPSSVSPNVYKALSKVSTQLLINERASFKP